MAGVYVNSSSLNLNRSCDAANSYSTYDSVAYSQSLKNFRVNSQEDFVFFGAEDGGKLIPIPCYKTNKVTIDGARVYYPAMSLADAKAFKALRNKSFLTREDKTVLSRVNEALDRCAESYGLSAGSIPIQRLSDYYAHFEQTDQSQMGLNHLKKVNPGVNR